MLYLIHCCILKAQTPFLKNTEVKEKERKSRGRKTEGHLNEMILGMLAEQLGSNELHLPLNKNQGESFLFQPLL